MTRCYVIDPEMRPSRPWPGPNSDKLDRGLRLMECDTTGWADGRVSQVAIHGKVAVQLVRAPRSTDHVERWRTWQDATLDGGWIAYVVRQNEDRRASVETKNRQVELLVAAAMIFLAAVIAALILVVLPQCQGRF